MAVDPFAKYQNAFQSIVPPQGVSVPQAAPVPSAISRYDQFLADQRINPNTIGTATIDRTTGQMVVPSIADEQLAVHKLNQTNAAKGDLLRAAHWAQQRRDGDDYIKYKQATRDLSNESGGQAYESKLKYWLAMAAATRPPTANGFAG